MRISLDALDKVLLDDNGQSQDCSLLRCCCWLIYGADDGGVYLYSEWLVRLLRYGVCGAGYIYDDHHSDAVPSDINYNLRQLSSIASYYRFTQKEIVNARSLLVSTIFNNDLFSSSSVVLIDGCAGTIDAVIKEVMQKMATSNTTSHLICVCCNELKKDSAWLNVFNSNDKYAIINVKTPAHHDTERIARKFFTYNNISYDENILAILSHGIRADRSLIMQALRKIAMYYLEVDRECGALNFSNTLKNKYRYVKWDKELSMLLDLHADVSVDELCMAFCLNNKLLLAKLLSAITNNHKSSDLIMIVRTMQHFVMKILRIHMYIYYNGGSIENAISILKIYAFGVNKNALLKIVDGTSMNQVGELLSKLLDIENDMKSLLIDKDAILHMGLLC